MPQVPVKLLNEPAYQIDFGDNPTFEHIQETIASKFNLQKDEFDIMLSGQKVNIDNYQNIFDPAVNGKTTVVSRKKSDDLTNGVSQSASVASSASSSSSAASAASSRSSGNIENTSPENLASKLLNLPQIDRRTKWKPNKLSDEAARFQQSFESSSSTSSSSSTPAVIKRTSFFNPTVKAITAGVVGAGVVAATDAWILPSFCAKTMAALFISVSPLAAVLIIAAIVAVCTALITYNYFKQPQEPAAGSELKV